MAYAIKRTDQGGGYLGPSGSTHSYVRELERAKIFLTHEQACRERCIDNEVVFDTNAMRQMCQLGKHCLFN